MSAPTYWGEHHTEPIVDGKNIILLLNLLVNKYKIDQI